MTIPGKCYPGLRTTRYVTPHPGYYPDFVGIMGSNSVDQSLSRAGGGVRGSEYDLRRVRGFLAVSVQVPSDDSY